MPKPQTTPSPSTRKGLPLAMGLTLAVAGCADPVLDGGRVQRCGVVSQGLAKLLARLVQRRSSSDWSLRASLQLVAQAEGLVAL